MISTNSEAVKIELLRIETLGNNVQSITWKTNFTLKFTLRPLQRILFNNAA
jgi:hypothetical protein